MNYFYFGFIYLCLSILGSSYLNATSVTISNHLPPNDKTTDKNDLTDEVEPECVDTENSNFDKNVSPPTAKKVGQISLYLEKCMNYEITRKYNNGKYLSNF